jgi:hypothetical protein
MAQELAKCWQNFCFARCIHWTDWRQILYKNGITSLTMSTFFWGIFLLFCYEIFNSHKFNATDIFNRTFNINFFYHPTVHEANTSVALTNADTIQVMPQRYVSGKIVYCNAKISCRSNLCELKDTYTQNIFFQSKCYQKAHLAVDILYIIYSLNLYI